MAFSSYDSIISSFSSGKGQDRFFHKTTSGITLAAAAGVSLWGAGTAPPAGSFGGTSEAVWTAQSASTTGALAFTNPTAPDTLHIALFGAYSSTATAGVLMVYDRLGQIEYLPLYNAAPPVTVAVTSNFTARLDSGEGAQLFAEITNSVVAGTPVFSINSYTNQAGTPGKASESVTCTAVTSAAIGRFPYTGRFFIPLAAGDSGVRSVESFTLTTASSTAAARINIVAARPLAFIPLTAANTWYERDMVLATIRLPRVRNNACLAFALLSGSTNLPVLHGTLTAVAG